MALHIYNSIKELKIDSDVIKIETIKRDKVTKVNPVQIESLVCFILYFYRLKLCNSVN